jgi:hypothetical protein
MTLDSPGAGFTVPPVGSRAASGIHVACTHAVQPRVDRADATRGAVGAVVHGGDAYMLRRPWELRGVAIEHGG